MHCSLSRISFPFCAMLPIAKVGACYRLTPTWYFQFSLRDYSNVMQYCNCSVLAVISS